MSAEIFVFDNVVSSNYQDAIEARIHENNFPWFYVPNVSRRTEGEDQLASDSIGFAHAFYTKDKGSISFVTEFLTPLRPVGGKADGLSFPTAAIRMGREVHPDPARRYPAGYSSPLSRGSRFSAPSPRASSPRWRTVRNATPPSSLSQSPPRA